MYMCLLKLVISLLHVMLLTLVCMYIYNEHIVYILPETNQQLGQMCCHLHYPDTTKHSIN